MPGVGTGVQFFMARKKFPNEGFSRIFFKIFHIWLLSFLSEWHNLKKYSKEKQRELDVYGRASRRGLLLLRVA